MDLISIRRAQTGGQCTKCGKLVGPQLNISTYQTMATGR